MSGFITVDRASNVVFNGQFTIQRISSRPFGRPGLGGIGGVGSIGGLGGIGGRPSLGGGLGGRPGNPVALEDSVDRVVYTIYIDNSQWIQQHIIILKATPSHCKFFSL